MKPKEKILKVGDKAPNFSAQAVNDQAFDTINLSDYLKENYVILLFYPYDFSFVCPTEILAFNNKYDVFSQLDTRILGISVDSHHAHLAWIQADQDIDRLSDLRYPLVSDLTKEISKKYNVLDNKLGVSLRSLFIIDKSGIIQYNTTNNLDFGRSVDETLRVLQAIQYVQSHPQQYCPANWQPGEKTIALDNPGSKDYFAVV